MIDRGYILQVLYARVDLRFHLLLPDEQVLAGLLTLLKRVTVMSSAPDLS